MRNKPSVFTWTFAVHAFVKYTSPLFPAGFKRLPGSDTAHRARVTWSSQNSIYFLTGSSSQADNGSGRPKFGVPSAFQVNGCTRVVRPS